MMKNQYQEFHHFEPSKQIIRDYILDNIQATRNLKNFSGKKKRKIKYSSLLKSNYESCCVMLNILFIQF